MSIISLTSNTNVEKYYILLSFIEVFLILATAVRDCRVSNDHNCFDPVRLVQTLHTLQTATNSIIVWLRFTLFTFSVARIDKTSVPTIKI